MLKYFVLSFILVHYVDGDITSNCSKKEKTMSYLDIAVEMIHKAKSNIPSCPDTIRNFTRSPVDCADILSMGHRKSGVYTIWPMNRLMENRSLDVYCDMDTDGGGWTVIQRRGSYGRPNDFFFKDWKSFKEGFGNIKEDFWIGNDNIFALTNQRLYSARFDLQDMTLTKKYALYDSFWIDDEFNNYTLHIADFSGDAGDSMIKHHNNMKFSTKDRDNDNNSGNCAETYKGAWWYNACHESNLNGLYLKGQVDTKGVNWMTFKSNRENMESTEIKIRPNKFSAPRDLAITPQ